MVPETPVDMLSMLKCIESLCLELKLDCDYSAVPLFKLLKDFQKLFQPRGEQ